MTYTEFPGSNTLSFSRDSIKGRRLFKVDWGDRINFCKALLGYVTSVGHVPLRSLAETFPGYDDLYCQDANIEPDGVQSEVDGEASYIVAKITAEYTPWRRGTTNAESEDVDDELEEAMATFTQGADIAGEFLSIPASRFRYVGATTTTGGDVAGIDYPVGRLTGNVDFTLTSDSEAEVPLTAIRACVGRVNSVVWFGAAAGHTIFLGASINRTITSEGVGAWEIAYRFRERIEATWNHVFDGDAWRAIESIEGNPPYSSVDFRVLWGV